jgi:hypothetical protein
MKRHTAKQYAHALYEATRDLSGKSLDFAVRAFGDILLRDRAIHMTDAIIAEYDAHAKKTSRRDRTKSYNRHGNYRFTQKSIKKCI